MSTSSILRPLFRSHTSASTSAPLRGSGRALVGWLSVVFVCLGVTLSAHAVGPVFNANIPNRTVLIDEPTDAYQLQVTDGDTAKTSLVFRGLSSNTNLVTTNNIFFGVAVGENYMTVTPTFGQTGTNTITVIASDGTSEATNSFLFTVNPTPAGYTRFAQAGAITIPGIANVATNANPYPSTNLVSGMTGWITNMTLTFSRFWHSRIQDVNMLLVAPNGTGIVLFAEISGQNRSCTNITVRLADGLTYPLPPDFALWSEELRPADFQGGGYFPGVAWTNAPGFFSSFNGLSPNGTWKLYVYDDTASNDGAILGGWSMKIATSTGPIISDITNRSIAISTNTGAIPFVINDPDTAISSLVLTASSSNTGLVPTNNIVFGGGTGTNRTVTVTPNVGQSGSATITINVSDGSNANSDSFVLTVGASGNPPTISSIPNKTTLAGRAVGPFNITIGDVETPVGNLVLTGSSSNTNLVPNGNIIFFNSGVTTLTVAPADGQTGTATITVNVKDEANNITSTTFDVTVSAASPPTGIFDKTNSISIPIASSATVYPSTNVVSGMVGSISAITLTLKRITHGAPHDLEMMLVGPNANNRAVFFAHVGGGTMTNVTVTVDDSAFYQLPPSPYATLTGSYKSADFVHDTFPGGAPGGPYGTNLANTFIGTSPNGSWSLYVMNDPAGTAVGTIAGGWSLAITTTGSSSAPTISDIANQTILVNSNTGALPFVITDPDTAVSSLVLTASSSNTNLVATNTIVFGGGTGTNRTVTVTPKTGQTGASTITIFVSDGTNTVNDTFLLTVNSGSNNNPPTFTSWITNLTTLVGRAVGPYNIGISDGAETPVGSLTLTGSSSNTNLVPNANILFFNSGVTTFTVAPADGVTGTAIITVNVSDGTNTTSTNLTLTVNSPGPGAGIFDKTNAITLPLQSVATTYPSTNVVSGLSGAITNVTLTLKGFTHTVQQNLEVLLVSPAGQKAVLQAHVGGGTASNVNYTLDDAATYFLPPSGFAILPGTYRPTDVAHDTFPSNSPSGPPSGPYATNLATFVSSAPNGNWLLYLMNDPVGTGSGTITRGWSLLIATDASNSPPTAANMVVSAPEDISTNLVLVGSDAGGPVTFSTLQAPTNGSLSNFNTNTGAITYRSATNYFGPDFFTYRVSDGGQFATGTVSITVSPVNDPPVATSFGVTLLEDGAANFTLLGSDVESAVTYGTVSNPSHGTLSGFNTNTGVITYKPQTNYFGSDAFNYRVSDGSLFVTGTVSITVSAVDDPATANNQSITMPKGTTTNLVLTASDVDSTNTVTDVMAVNGAVTPDNWTLIAGATKAAAVAANDGDATYILSGILLTAQQQFTLADPVHIQPGDIINSVTLRATCRRNSTPAGNVQLMAVLAGNTSAGAAHGTGKDYADYTDVFTTRPGGGAWTLSDVQNLEIRIQNTQLLREIACTRFDASVSFIGNTNRVYAILSAPAHGTLGALNPNNGAVGYTPNAGYAGADSFTFTVNAGGVLSTGLVSIVVTGTGSITIGNAGFLDANHFRLTGTGNANTTYQVQASTNLQTWQTLGTTTANGAGAFEFVDALAGSFPRRFYRVTTP